MGKKRQKVKKKCCEKYLKSGRHCKNCPLMISDKISKKIKSKESGKKAEKKKKNKKVKKNKEKKK